MPCHTLFCPIIPLPSPCPALHYQALPCPALPCPALPCLALPCPALPCRAVPCRTVPCPALLCPALPSSPSHTIRPRLSPCPSTYHSLSSVLCRTLRPALALASIISSLRHSPCPALPCPGLPCSALPYPVPPSLCPSIPCLVMPCPVLPCPALPCHALPCPPSAASHTIRPRFPPRPGTYHPLSSALCRTLRPAPTPPSIISSATPFL